MVKCEITSRGLTLRPVGFSWQRDWKHSPEQGRESCNEDFENGKAPEVWERVLQYLFADFALESCEPDNEYDFDDEEWVSMSDTLGESIERSLLIEEAEQEGWQIHDVSWFTTSPE